MSFYDFISLKKEIFMNCREKINSQNKQDKPEKMEYHRCYLIFRMNGNCDLPVVKQIWMTKRLYYKCITYYYKNY